MNDRFVNKKLKELNKTIPVNSDLKFKLRNEFVPKRVFRWKFSAAAAVAVAMCIVLAVYMLLPDKLVEKVNAASLKILNQVPFVDIGGGSNIDSCEYSGTIYTAVYGKGIYTYDSTGYHRLYGKNVESISISRDGKRIAFSDGSLKIMEISKQKVTELLKEGNLDYHIHYEDPSWSSDGNSLIYVKKVEDRKTHEEKLSKICELNLKNMKTIELADGIYSPSFANGGKSIVFVKRDKIIIMDLKTGTEKVIDEGRFPAVSPDGGYVAYVKTENKTKKTDDNITVTESIADVWISDVNLATKKRITSNFININEKGEESVPKPGNVLKLGAYEYYNPSWSSDSGSVYVVKGSNFEGDNFRVMKISFSQYEIAPRDTVRNFLQALVLRDDDYASSLMIDQSPILIPSNPHPVGYKIIGSGKDYVDAETYSAYTAQPFYSISRSRYFLKKGEDGYKITNIKNLRHISVSYGGGISVPEESDSMVINKDNQKKILFKESEIPKRFLPQGKFRLASLSYDDSKGALLFTIQVLQDKGQTAAVRVISYTLEKRTFKMVDDVKKLGIKYNIGVEDLVISPDGNYASIDLFSDDDPVYRGYVRVYDLNYNKAEEPAGLLKDTMINSMHTEFWDQEYLVLEASCSGQIMRYRYDPALGKIMTFGVRY